MDKFLEMFCAAVELGEVLVGAGTEVLARAGTEVLAGAGMGPPSRYVPYVLSREEVCVVCAVCPE